MSDQQDYEYEQEQEPQESPAALRAAAERGRAAQAEAEAAKRELAFVKAGVNTDTPAGRMFARAYEGDLDVDKIRGEYASLFPPAEQATEQQDDAEEQARQEALRQQTAERRDLTSQHADLGAEPPPPDLVAQGYREFEAAVENGTPRELAFRHALNGHIAAANAGQPGAVWDGWSDEQLDSFTVPRRDKPT